MCNSFKPRLKHFINFEKEKLISLLMVESVDKAGNKKIKAQKPSLACEALIKHSDFKFLRMFPKSGMIFFYSEKKGYYMPMEQPELKVYLKLVLKKFNCEELKDYRYIDSIYRNLMIEGDICEDGEVRFDRGYVSFKNGILNLKTTLFQNHTPEVFLSTGLPYNYDKDASCPQFLSYLSDLSEGFQDRIEFLRCMLYAIVYQRTDLQVFLSMWGIGGSGKSIFTNVACLMVGDDGVHSTSLKALNEDQFEIMNLLGKKLILISDAERYSANFSIVKAYVGGDPMRGRRMFKQGTVEVRADGIIAIVANQPLAIKDSSNAIMRRMRPFKTKKSFVNERRLLTCVDGVWEGDLVDELPGIFNWVISCPKENIRKYITHFKENVPSLSGVLEESRSMVSPLSDWVDQETQECTTGSYIGFGADNPKQMRELRERKALYPAYKSWSERHGFRPINHTSFSTELITILNTKGVTCEKERKAAGMYLYNIELKPNIFDRDYILGAPLISNSEETPESKPNDVISVSLSKPSHPNEISLKEEGLSPSVLELPPNRKQHPSLDPEMYEKYKGYLAMRSPLKTYLNKESKKLPLSLQNSILEDYLKQMKIPSAEFKGKAADQINKGLEKIINFGAIPYTYKMMGLSPRLVPVSYGNSINSTKKIVRKTVYTLLGKLASDRGYYLVDLDLKSCYTSILLGLYPKELEVMQLAIEKVGLWNFIKEEFIKDHNENNYHKPAVKICVYSSFFLGGNKAMMEGIMKSFRDDLGLTKGEFLRSDAYEEAYRIAQSVTSQMQNSDVIADFRDISKFIKDAYMDDFLEGPTGHAFKVTDETFRSAYPNFLQSYEIALLAQGFLNTVAKYPELEIIGHYHDGNVVAVPKEKYDEIMEFMTLQVKEVGQKLSLGYPQVIEIQQIFK
jgi:P4 family phage/plasmid primase-like protien